MSASSRASSVPSRSSSTFGPEKAFCTGTCWSSANPIRSAIGSLTRSRSASSSPVKWSRSVVMPRMVRRARYDADLLKRSDGGPMRTLIKGGTIVNADATTAADVLIDGERIALIGTELEVEAERTLDATGKWVIPGAIDVHTHMELPFGGTAAKDTFETGTRAAAFGGTTTIIDFAVQGKGQALREGLDTWHAKAEGHATIDYGFHMIMSDVTDDTLVEMDTLVDEGVTDFKLFTAYPGVFYSDDGAIFRAMQQTAKNGGLILMHAENGMAIDVVAAQNVAAGNTDPYFHGTSRSPVMEGEATNRVIRLAQVAGVPVYIVHLSAHEALNEVRRARNEGLPAYAETCPQYLFLTLEDMGNGFRSEERRVGRERRARGRGEESSRR